MKISRELINGCGKRFTSNRRTRFCIEKQLCPTCQAQKQERLDCYKKVLDKFETIYNLRQGSPQLQFILEQIILELKQEIKILEEK